MADAKRIVATGAVVAVLAAGGMLPARAVARDAQDATDSVENVSGTIGVAFTGDLLVEKKRRKGNSVLIAVDTDRQTVVSQGGIQKSMRDLSLGEEVTVFGTKITDGGILASKIVIRS